LRIENLRSEVASAKENLPTQPCENSLRRGFISGIRGIHPLLSWANAVDSWMLGSITGTGLDFLTRPTNSHLLVLVLKSPVYLTYNSKTKTFEAVDGGRVGARGRAAKTRKIDPGATPQCMNTNAVR
jgi:hypothetical protein